ncbi:hypothetical protein LEN26_020926 [Aphanomyces euteiches]|nr:hypothetical protein LEN26_020926 [Aphanomyces euteiches]KAH9107590.1 hypothetical protein AeMF1_017112 [Aphanomyces euteiches]
MGRREVWSSYDEEEASSKKAAQEQATTGIVDVSRPFNVELLRNKVVFGGLVGATTGATFGFGATFYSLASVDITLSCLVGAFQNHHSKHGSVNSQAMVGAARAAGTTGVVFGGFFLAYQGLKTTIEQLRGQEDLLNAGAAIAVTGAPFYRNLTFRSHMGYAALLVALDYFHEEMNNFRK